MRDDNEGRNNSESKTIQIPYIDSEDQNPLLEFDSPKDISGTSKMKCSITFDMDAVSFLLKALAMGAVPSGVSKLFQAESASCGVSGLKFCAKIKPSSNTAVKDELQ